MLEAFDFETYYIEPGLLAPPIVCGAFVQEGSAPVLLGRGEALDRLNVLLESDRTIVGHNVAYDFGCFLRHRPDKMGLVFKAYDQNRVFDTRIAATLNAIAEGRLLDGQLLDKHGRACVDPAKGKQTNRYSLALVVQEWLGRKNAKANSGMVLRYHELDGVPMSAWPEHAIQYPKDDALNTLEAAQAMLCSAKNLESVSFQSQAALCMHLGAINGWRTDAARVSSLSALIAENQGRLLEIAKAAGLLKENKRNVSGYSKNTKLIKALVTEKWGPLTPKTETGQVSMARETLEDSGHPALQALGELSKWDKFAVYVPVLQQGVTTPVTVEGNPLLATGRASYEGLIQLMPRKGGIRECFIFRGVGCSTDYAAVELSSLSQVCIWTVGHSSLGDAINKGLDPHSLLGSQLTGSTYEEFLKRVKAKDVEALDLRQASKAANFGFPGGMGEATFVLAKRREGLHVCELFYRDGKCGEVQVTEWKKRQTAAPLCLRCLEQTRDLRNSWFTAWPEMRQYLNHISNLVEVSDVVETPVTKMLRGGMTYSRAANHMFQSLAAVGAKRAVIELTRMMYSDNNPLSGSRLCLFAHDETLIDIPDRGVDAVDAAARMQADLMVKAMRGVIPDVKISAEPALMYRWSKDAKTVQDEKGRYVPWDSKK